MFPRIYSLCTDLPQVMLVKSFRIPQIYTAEFTDDLAQITVFLWSNSAHIVYKQPP